MRIHVFRSMIGKQNKTKLAVYLFLHISLVVIIIIFVVLMNNRISSEYVTRGKVLIFADLMYYRIVIFENTQAQCFDASFLNNDNTVMHQLCQFLATCSKPILVFIKTTK